MIEYLKNIWLTLNAIGFYPAVMLTGFGLYFILVQWLGMDKKKSAPWILIVSFVGQLAFVQPKTMFDIVNVIFMGMAQAVAAIGIYSFADKYGLMDKFGKMIGRKIEKDESSVGVKMTDNIEKKDVTP